MKTLAISVLLFGTLNTVNATVISYDTVGSSFIGTFNGAVASGTSISATSGSSAATLSYSSVPAGSTFDDATPGTNISYGFFTLSFTGPDTSIAFPIFTFSLNVHETAPGIGSEAILAVSNNGTVSSNSSNVNVFYAPTAFSLPSSFIPNTAFTIVNPTQIVPSTTNNGVSSIQGFATGAARVATPEPATVLFMGAGLLSLGFLSRKKVLCCNSDRHETFPRPQTN